MAYNKAEKSDAPMRKKGGIRRRKKYVYSAARIT